MEERQLTKTQIASETGLKPRDLRAVDSKFLRSRMPVILARDGATVLSLEHVRVVVRHDGVWVFEPWHPSTRVRSPPYTHSQPHSLYLTLYPRDAGDGAATQAAGRQAARAKLGHLLRVLRPRGGAVRARKAAAHLTVAHQVMDSLCASLDRRLHTLTAAVTSTLDAVVDDTDERTLTRLLPLKNSLASFEVLARELRSAIQVRASVSH